MSEFNDDMKDLSGKFPMVGEGKKHFIAPENEPQLRLHEAQRITSEAVCAAIAAERARCAGIVRKQINRETGDWQFNNTLEDIAKEIELGRTISVSEPSDPSVFPGQRKAKKQ